LLTERARCRTGSVTDGSENNPRIELNLARQVSGRDDLTEVRGIDIGPGRSEVDGVRDVEHIGRNGEFQPLQ
jgi:hypothetical protein